MATIHELAADAYRCFETATRDDGSHYVRTRDDAPEWVGDLVRAAHGDMLPDDWRYQAIRDALGAIDDAGADADLDDLGHEFADGNVDTYTGERIAWLGSHASRAGYCDEAADEFGGEDLGIVERIGLGQYAELREVYASVLESLRERADEIGDDDEPDDDDGFLSPAGQLGAQTAASFAGRYLGTFDDEDDALAAIVERGRADGFYPNVWRIDDHGGHALVEDIDWDDDEQ